MIWTYFRANAAIMGAPLALMILTHPTVAVAQYEPSAPIAPKSAQECSVFSAQVSQFRMAMTREHQQCLDSSNKTNRPLAEGNNRICSQPACQRLHDYAYGSGVADQQRVSACFSEVNQYQARKAEEQRLREQQERERAIQIERQKELSENQRQQYEAAKTKIAAQRAAWEAREAKRQQLELDKKRDTDVRLKAAKDDETRRNLQHDRDAELARIAAERSSDVAPIEPLPPPNLEPENATQRSGDLVQPSPPEPGMEVLSALKKYPFERPNGPEIMAGSDPNDPSTWRSPFADRDSSSKEEAIGLSAKLFEVAFKKAADTLTDDIQRAEAALPKAQAAAYIREAEDVRSGMKGLESLFKYYDYALRAFNIAKAETSDERSRAMVELGVKMTEDAAKAGTAWLIQMLPERAATVLAGPVAWGGSIVLKSEYTASEPSDVLQRPQDFSLDLKKQVLFRQAQAFSKYKDTWSPAQRDELRRLELLVRQETEK